ncbi:transcriptional regulator [Burkholderia sp. SFA1]|uniref:GntR family transcriptional regulator n=1 Tax=unclassified Caballeronia TaxID=2646786 RepID=UPI001F353BBB|nr:MULTISPECIES: GntR family transcriptional regulator [unclassified Caballeronia]MCE4545485.1 GntR family transcriptional regulator [Caballeronia sp. PC1]MCE4570911.1 GntR family transcriptional regulator [Caballeronia sp. CLC5]BBP99245.1 transcriptional regulator [Burkholderia sp. SFA1]
MKRNVEELDRDDAQAPSQDRKATLAQALRHRILRMELAPGASLDEVALAEEFGLSRPPVRELMRQMAAEGYIELEANRTARVASMNYDSLRNYFLAAPLIYVATTKLAAVHATQAEIDGLKRIQERFRAAVEGNAVDERVLENDHFHFAIGKMAHNPYLLPSLCRLLIDHARLGKTFYQPRDERMDAELAEAVQQHEDIIDAIQRRDADAAGEIVREHVYLARRNMASYVAPEGVAVAIEF